MIDLSRVNLELRAGIEMMGGGVNAVWEQGGRVQLSGVNERMVNVLDIIKSDGFVNVSTTIDKALGQIR
ncbi:uncharacterized protein METZ01_LOCUS381807 [marine metagenome]|uniref:STAS domain-containing protein n=1 Tax=marine metagenome TaxID=408172 RepID=A0A382U3W7_9ZZZZ